MKRTAPDSIVTTSPARSDVGRGFPGHRSTTCEGGSPGIIVCVLLAVVLTTSHAFAQDDVISRARHASAEGRRAEGLALLESHLADSPRDIDARLTYGLMLSWDGKYDQARTELRSVLAAAPDYSDAKVALMNVAWWSGQRAEALDLSTQI